MKKLTYKLIFLAIALVPVPGFALTATAAAITNVWNVSDAAGNCSSGDHGLWTNNMMSGSSCANYFSISGTLTEFDDGTANLSATAVNPDSVVATIDISFGGFADTYSPTKNGGGTDESDWDFYTQITSGVISIDATDYFVGIHDAHSDSNSANDYVMQIGTGANDKTGVFGASVWLDVFDAQGAALYTGNNHWDINVNLAPVPVPAAVWLFGSGLIGLVGVARRKA